MKIEHNTVVTITVKMYDAQGELLEESSEPLTYLQGHDDIFPMVEQALAGKSSGEAVTVHLEPEDAFGDYDAQLVVLVPLETLSDEIEIGSVVEGVAQTSNNEGSMGVDAGQDASDEDQRRLFTVTDIADGQAVLDGNHPLAGVAVRMDIIVLEVRPATPEEIEQAGSPTVPDFLSVKAPDGSRYH